MNGTVRKVVCEPVIRQAPQHVIDPHQHGVPSVVHHRGRGSASKKDHSGRVHVRNGDSDDLPFSIGAVASGGTVMAGGAIHGAVAALRRTLRRSPPRSESWYRRASSAPMAAT